MNDKRKNALLVFFTLSTIVLAVLLVMSGSNSAESEIADRNDEVTTVTHSSVDTFDGSAIQKENVCERFLEAYYSVSHSKSEAAALTKCKPFITAQLYEKLSPSEEGREYSAEEVDIDYNSTISIGDVYQNSVNSNEIILRCTIKRTVNEMTSINDYFAIMKVEYINQEWLVNHFELISVQGG